MTTYGHTTSSSVGAVWTPARIFLLVSAAYHLPIGFAGLLVDRTFPIGSAAAERAGSAYIFGLFATNGWHSLAAFLLGVVSLYFALRPAHARTAALAIGILHIALFVGLVIWPPATFWLASNNADQAIHATTAVTATLTGLITRPPGETPVVRQRDR